MLVQPTETGWLAPTTHWRPAGSAAEQPVASAEGPRRLQALFKPRLMADVTLMLRSPAALSPAGQDAAGQGQAAGPARGGDGAVHQPQLLLRRRELPEGDVLEASVVINNQDVGFVTAGQNAEIKIDAFPFTRYGLLSGTVAEVSRDARSLQVANNPEFGPKNKSDETENIERGERLVFTARILLQKHSLNVNGEEVELLPGMSMKAEIKTGKRRLADFFLAPLRQYDQEIFRER